MNGLPYFAFYASDFLSGVAAMTLEDRGAYITLLCNQWVNGSIPDDLPSCIRICGGGAVSERVLDKFQNLEGTGTRLNARLEKEREKCMKAKAKAKTRKTKWNERNRNAAGTRSGTVPDTPTERLGSDSDSLLPLGKRDIQEPGNPSPEKWTGPYPAMIASLERCATIQGFPASKVGPMQWASVLQCYPDDAATAAQVDEFVQDSLTKHEWDAKKSPTTRLKNWLDVGLNKRPKANLGQNGGQGGAEKPRGTWDLKEQIELLRSERDRLYMSDFQNTGGPERNPKRYAEWLEVSNKMRELQGQIAGKA